MRLSTLSKGSGCGCKIPQAVLSEILRSGGENPVFKDLLVGSDTYDDAAVLDLGNGQALISTTDFFTPLVDDPFDFGAISAANAISDVYAMGGKPVLAIAILGWPVDTVPAELAGKVIQGAREICREAGIPLAGGHSISISEPVFGLAVNGIVRSDRILKNNTAREGDILFLTKALGTGVMSAAFKREAATAEEFSEAVTQMKRLNRIGEVLGRVKGVNAVTDITGFGLLGHVIEMAEGSSLTAEIDFKSIPILGRLDEYLGKNIIPDNTYRNWNSYEKRCSGIQSMKAFQVLCDPQTSGGLLISAAENSVKQLEELFAEYDLSSHINPIGRMIAQAAVPVTVKE